jgi:hypothetical protein
MISNGEIRESDFDQWNIRSTDIKDKKILSQRRSVVLNCFASIQRQREYGLLKELKKVEDQRKRDETKLKRQIKQSKSQK